MHGCIYVYIMCMLLVINIELRLVRNPSDICQSSAQEISSSARAWADNTNFHRGPEKNMSAQIQHQACKVPCDCVLSGVTLKTARVHPSSGVNTATKTLPE